MIELADLVNYHKEFRSALFTAGFTAGSFLFAMKSAILKTMKDDLYKTPDYQKLVNERIALGKTATYYGPLKRFSILLSLSIFSSILSAIFQITIGYFSTTWGVVLCLIAALLSWILIAISIALVARNWYSAIESAERLAREENAEKIREMTQKIAQ